MDEALRGDKSAFMRLLCGEVAYREGGKVGEELGRGVGSGSGDGCSAVGKGGG